MDLLGAHVLQGQREHLAEGLGPAMQPVVDGPLLPHLGHRGGHFFGRSAKVAVGLRHDLVDQRECHIRLTGGRRHKPNLTAAKHRDLDSRPDLKVTAPGLGHLNGGQGR